MGDFKKKSVSLEADFVLGPGKEEAACVDLDGEWAENSKVFRHPDFVNSNIEFVGGEVGEGGDHMNITLKNIADTEVKISGTQNVVFVSEDQNESDPGLEKQNDPDSGREKSTASSSNSEEQSNPKPSSDQESIVEKSNESDDKESVGQVKNSIDQSKDSVDSSDQIKESSEQSMDSGDQMKESSDQQKESNDQVKDAEKVEDSEENVANMDVSSTMDETAEESMDIDEPEAASKNQTGDECENIDNEKDITESDLKTVDSKEKSESINGDSVDKEENSETNETNLNGASKDVDNGRAPEKDSETADSQSEEIDIESKKKESSKETENEKEANNEEEKEEKSSDKEEEKKIIGEKPMIMMFVNETEADEEKEVEEEREKEVDEEEKELEEEEKEVGEEEKKEKESGEAEKKDEKDEKDDSKTTKEDAAMETEETKIKEAKETKETSDKSKIESEENTLKEAKKEIPTETPTKIVEEKKEDIKKPTLKLASFADMANSSVEKKVETNLDIDESVESIDETRIDASGCCSDCQLKIDSLKSAVVWETMQFCNITCLAKYQSGLSSCSSCKKTVSSSSLGKYCVRFGSDIKQFCSNMCLEDYKKGLKVCSYCQKDISGGEGFLAPIGNKGQFKDFCEANCLKKYEVMNNIKEQEKEVIPCSVCQEVKLIEREIIRASQTIKLCRQYSCFSAYKFVNKVKTAECPNCQKNFDLSIEPVSCIYYDGLMKTYCSKACQNVSVMMNRKIIPCANCKVKKYNFDMIEMFENGHDKPANLYCSLHCRALLTGTQGQRLPQTSTSVSNGYSLTPVISAVSSLAPVGGGGGGLSNLPVLPTEPIPQTQLQPQIQIQTQTVREVLKETQVLPPEVPEWKNKGMQTKPFMLTKGVSCKPSSNSKSTQTETPPQPIIVPIPIPIHIPTPCKMYNVPFPVPVPIPLPFPVPVFIPTTRNTMKGILKQIKKIQNKIPADPYEAELLALAGDIAAQDKDSSDSNSDAEDLEADDCSGLEKVQNMVPLPDLENEMAPERIVPKPLPSSTPEPPGARQFPAYNQYPTHNKRRASQRDSDADDQESEEDWKPQSIWDQRPPTRQRQPQRRQRGRSTQQNKRARVDTVREQQAAAVIAQQPKERPDVNHHLKFTYGVNAWKHWVVGKNAELEKQRAQGKYQKSFETDILKLRADELNFTLCMFVKEVKKPNGDSYAADSILYLVLGIQEFLFENGRIDNVFTDAYFDGFTTALHEVVKEFKLPMNELGYFVTRIEEEHLWESKQLGAHSPHVLLNTLVYFNTKYFQLKGVDAHLKLSFSHIMKHWKKTAVSKPGQNQRTVLLRYYPPPAKGQKNEERKMYEQHENHENPLRCPVKLYEFYLSKCPESTKNRNDMFYLQPERNCVPDSPVWYSAQLLNRFSMEKMLSRLLMVREVQEHMLAADQ